MLAPSFGALSGKKITTTSSSLTEQDVFEALGECELFAEGDNDHLVDYTTFSDDGTGVCNTICANEGKTCISGTAAFFERDDDYDMSTYPTNCADGVNNYKPFDEVEGSYPMALCRCC